MFASAICSGSNVTWISNIINRRGAETQSKCGISMITFSPHFLAGGVGF